MSLLALDLGTQTGWALGRPGDPTVTSGSQSFALGRFDGGGMRGLRFQRWLDEMLPGVERVAYEEVRRHMGVDAAHAYGGFQLLLTTACEKYVIPYEAIPVGTIKKFATGHGNAPKPAMIAAVQAWGYAPRDDNEADAIALWRLVAGKLDLRPPAPAPARGLRVVR